MQGLLNRIKIMFGIVDVPAVVTKTDKESVLALPSIKNECQQKINHLVISAGFYQFYGETYDCHTPGLYRFTKPFKENKQALVLDKSNALLNALLISNLGSRGNKDDRRPIDTLKKIAKKRLLSLTCSKLALLTSALLNDNKIDNRCVYSLTTEKPNFYNDGHSLLEVWDSNLSKYVLVDVDKKGCFSDENGKLLSLIEVTELKEKSKNIRFNAFFPNAIYPVKQLKNKVTGFDYEMLEYAFNAVDGGVLNYLNRNVQVPVMREDDVSYIGIFNKHQGENIRQRYPNYVLLSIADFKNKFYQA